MLKRFQLVVSIFFIVTGVYALLNSLWVDGAWALTFGIGWLFMYYAKKYPALSRGILGWSLAIGWVVIFGVLTIMRFQMLAAV